MSISLRLNKQPYLLDALPLNNNVAHPNVKTKACIQCVWTTLLFLGVTVFVLGSWPLRRRFCAAKHMTQDSGDVNKKRGEEKATVLAAPNSELSRENCTSTARCCLHERVILERFSTRRWLTTLTTHSALFQHITMWLMCVDEETALSAAELSIIPRWLEPRMTWAVLCFQGSFHQ